MNPASRLSIADREVAVFILVDIGRID